MSNNDVNVDKSNLEEFISEISISSWSYIGTKKQEIISLFTTNQIEANPNS
jgi:hypothetical protein